jgi:hypothetical protein
MAPDPDPILEAEVLEIDGKAPPIPDPSARPSPTRGSASWKNWQHWPGQVRTIHPLWWPVILVAGGILLFLILTLGLVVAVLVTIFRILRSLLRALFS